MTTMTIKSFKEQSQVKEIGPAVGLAVRAAPYAVPAAIAVGRAVSAYSKGRSPSSGKKSPPKTTTAYSPKAPSAKGQREEVQLDEKMPPEAHVARSKKNPDMFCVFDKDGKEVKLFKDKKDAEAYAVKNHDELMGESLWANMHARRKAGKRKKKPGEKGYPKTLDIEGFASHAQRRAAFASGYKAKGKKGKKEQTEGYSSFAQQKAVWANRADGGKGHPDNKKKSKKESGYKPFPKAGKKPLHGDNVAEISRDDMVKKVSSTIGSKVPMMINPQDKEKNKIKTGLDRLRKALGPNHAINKSRA
jgi:hypothetical protein